MTPSPHHYSKPVDQFAGETTAGHKSEAGKEARCNAVAYLLKGALKEQTCWRKSVFTPIFAEMDGVISPVSATSTPGRSIPASEEEG